MGFPVRLTDNDGQHWFMEWSTIVDAPVSAAMCWEHFQKHYEYHYGLKGIDRLTEWSKEIEKAPYFFGLYGMFPTYSDAVDKLLTSLRGENGEFIEGVTQHQLIQEYKRDKQA